MVTTLPFALVDVFADAPLSGNPLAVVAAPSPDTIEVATMRRLAREFNQSETTIVMPPEQGGDRRLRSFTPSGDEVVGAGHNALGAWWWLSTRGDLELHDGVNRLVQELGDEPLALTITARDGVPVDVRMRQRPPVFHPAQQSHGALAGALGVPRAQLGARSAPVRTVSTGVDHLMVPVTADALDHLAPDSDQLRDTLSAAGAQGCYAYALTPEADVVAEARFFNPTVGIREDPATGSAAGPLAAHLADLGVVPSVGEVAIAQGRHSGRPSRITVALADDHVEIVGACVVVASGEIAL